MDDNIHNSPSTNRTLMGVLSYLGPLVLVPLLVEKHDHFVRFHVRQGLVLLAIEVLVWVAVSWFMWQLWMLANLINLGTIILSIVGIANVIKGKEEPLPLIGQFAHYFKI